MITVILHVYHKISHLQCLRWTEKAECINALIVESFLSINAGR
jgi:hypothetical protein